jgi:peptide/nickel transport system permease protein
MTGFILRRIANMIPTLLLISFLSFMIIQLAPGDFFTRLALNPRVDQEELNRQREAYGLDKPAIERYFIWLKEIACCMNWGYSFEFSQPVWDLFTDRLPATMLITIPVFFFTWLVAIPLGVFSATHQYSLWDNTLTFVTFLSLSIPGFFFALILMYVLVDVFDAKAVGGLFSQQYIAAPWTWDKFTDYLQHLWPVVIVIGMAAAAGLMRFMRGTMLDVMNMQYVKTASAKGLHHRTVIYKHALRNAINPMISIFGQSLPILISGTLITAIVFNLPNVEKLFFSALQVQDEYLALSILVFFSFVLLLGNLVADIALALTDPRIRYE